MHWCVAVPSQTHNFLVRGHRSAAPHCNVVNAFCVSSPHTEILAKHLLSLELLCAIQIWRKIFSLVFNVVSCVLLHCDVKTNSTFKRWIVYHCVLFPAKFRWFNFLWFKICALCPSRQKTLDLMIDILNGKTYGHLNCFTASPVKSLHFAILV